MMGPVRFVLLAVMALALGACASGAPLSEAPAAKEPQSGEVARIVVFRTDVIGAAIQPEVLVDGRPTSVCQPNSVFFVDVPPGQHRVTASTETTATVNATLPKATQVYIECSIGFGLMVGRPQLRAIEASAAKSRIEELVFTGNYSIN